MDFTRLTEHVMDVIKEEQVKLGYRKERISLYYPLDSLNLLLEGNYDISGMHEQLKAFDGEAVWGAGQVEIWNEKERFCLSFSPEVAEYVHTHTADSGFLYDLVDAVSRHGTSVEEVLAVFHRYSEHVRCEKMPDPDFDCLVWFEDGVPDTYRYCLKEEMGHVIYHRYTEEDYRRLM